MDQKTTFALIPARSGSKSIKDKNLQCVNKKSLLEWSIKTCIKSKNIDRIFVSTDSEYYADLAISYGAEVPFLRPLEISGDSSTDTDLFRHFIDNLPSFCDLPNYIAHIRPTSPLRKPMIIDEAIKVFHSQILNNYTALRSVHQMPESAYKSFEIENDQLKLLCNKSKNLDIANNARQSFPKTYIANGYVDIISVEFLKRTNLMHGTKVLPFITEEVLEVDSQFELDLIENIASMRNDYYEGIFEE